MALDHARSHRLGQRPTPGPAAAAVSVVAYADLPDSGYDGQIGYTTSDQGVYVYDGTTGAWVGVGGGAEVLNDLNDVTVTQTAAELVDRQVLAWNAPTSQWEPYGPIVHHGTEAPETVRPAASHPWRFYVKHV